MPLKTSDSFVIVELRCYPAMAAEQTCFGANSVLDC